MSAHRINKIQREKIRSTASVCARAKKDRIINEENFSEYITKPVGTAFLDYLKTMNPKLSNILKQTHNKIDTMPRIQKKFLLFLFNNFYAAFNKKTDAAGKKSGAAPAENKKTADKKEKAPHIDNKGKLIEIIKHNISNRRGVLQSALTDGYIKISDNLLLMLDFNGKKPCVEEAENFLKNTETIKLKDKKTGKYITIKLNKPTVFIQKQLNALYLEAQKSKTYPKKLAKEAVAKAVKAAAAILGENRKSAPVSKDPSDNIAAEKDGPKDKKSALKAARAKIAAAGEKIIKSAGIPGKEKPADKGKKKDTAEKTGSSVAGGVKDSSKAAPFKIKSANTDSLGLTAQTKGIGVTKDSAGPAAQAQGKIETEIHSAPQVKEKADKPKAFTENTRAASKSAGRAKSLPSAEAEPLRQKITHAADKNNNPAFGPRERAVLSNLSDEVIKEAVKENPVFRQAVSGRGKITPAKADYIFDDLATRQMVKEYKELLGKIQEKSPGTRWDITKETGVINDLKRSISNMNREELIKALDYIKHLNASFNEPKKADESVRFLYYEAKIEKIIPDGFYKKDRAFQRRFISEKIDSIMLNLRAYFSDVLNLYGAKFISPVYLENILNMLTENFKNLAYNTLQFNNMDDLNKLLNSVTDFVGTFKSAEFAAIVLDERLPEHTKLKIIEERLNYMPDITAPKIRLETRAANLNKESARAETENADKIKFAIARLNYLINEREITATMNQDGKELTKNVKINVEILSGSRLIDRLKKMTEDEVKDFINNLYKIFFTFRKDIAEKIKNGYFEQTARTPGKKAEKPAGIKDLNEFYNFLNKALKYEDCEPNQKYSIADYLDYEVNLE